MSTDTFNIILQKGIAGGFAPPTPDALYFITRSLNSDVFNVKTQVRPHGKPSLQPPTSKELKVADHANEIAKLLQILRDLPVQYPGAEDLYGRNISIVLQVDPAAYIPTGSFAGHGIPSPTDQQKAQFGVAVDIIEKWAAA